MSLVTRQDSRSIGLPSGPLENPRRGRPGEPWRLPLRSPPSLSWETSQGYTASLWPRTMGFSLSLNFLFLPPYLCFFSPLFLLITETGLNLPLKTLLPSHVHSQPLFCLSPLLPNFFCFYLFTYLLSFWYQRFT